jgi:hypothetical protein
MGALCLCLCPVQFSCSYTPLSVIQGHTPTAPRGPTWSEKCCSFWVWLPLPLTSPSPPTPSHLFSPMDWLPLGQVSRLVQSALGARMMQSLVYNGVRAAQGSGYGGHGGRPPPLHPALRVEKKLCPLFTSLVIP